MKKIIPAFVALVIVTTALSQTVSPENRKEQLKERRAFLEKRRAQQEELKRNGLQEPSIADIHYGPYERNLMDVYQAKGDGPRPVLLVIHGGGFVGGDKTKLRSDPFVKQAYDSGISIVLISYRYVSTDPFPTPFLDGVRALQFIRYNANKWNIDPNRIAAYGGSAGANMSVWIATQDDMADPNSSDPVKQQSTRLSCVIGKGTQTFNDPELILEKIGGNPDVHPSLLLAAGVKTIEEAKTDPAARKLAHDCSAINFVTPDDAPLYLSYGISLGTLPLPPDTPIGQSIHHPMFGVLMKEKYDAVGRECVVVTKDTKNPPDMFGWLEAHL